MSDRSRPPKMLLLLLVLMMAATMSAVLAAESDSNRHGRRSGNWKGGRKRATTTTTTTTTTADPFSILGDDEDDGLGSAVAASESVNQPLQDQPPGVETCEVARLKCAYRVGCGLALQNYMVGCSDVITGASQRCSDHCRNSLIALTSTDEGEALMKCKCSDAFCSESKQRIDICRSAVLKATHNSTIVSCGVAQWICMADPLCSTALDYYHRFCRSMFTGKKCTLRCKNSISILRRQEKAAKLSTCVCDGSEDYDCPSILDNMDRLCYHKSSVTATPAHSGEGGGQGVEEQNENNKSKNHQHHHHHHHQTTTTSQNNNDGRTTGHNSGHHPDQSLHPHHTQKRPHHPPHLRPPHHTGTDDIESNEVELHRTRPQYPTLRKPSSGATTTASWTIVFGLFLAVVVMHPVRLAVGV